NIHFFSQKETVKKGVGAEKLGMRGRQANEFAELSLPILPGFIIDCDAAPRLAGEDVLGLIRPHLKKVEEIVGKSFGDSKNPLLFKIVVSPNLAISNYPTLHDFGLARDTVEGFASWVGANFAAHEVLFLVRGMLAVEDRLAELEGRDKDRASLAELAQRVGKGLASDKPGKSAQALMDEYAPILPEGFFDGAEKQLEIALKRVSRLIKLDEQDADDTALLVQPMVYGNYGKDSASGAFFTRDIVLGEPVLQGEYYQERFNEIGATGKDITKIDPSYLKELEKIARKIEDKHLEIRQIRFTIENKKLWLIEQRQVVAKSTQADLRLALDLNGRKVVNDEYVVMSIAPGRLNEILHPIVDLGSVKKLEGVSGGIAGAPGAAIGRVFFSTESLLEAHREAQQKSQDKRLILCMNSTFAEDVKAIEVATGVLSAEGGFSAHASVVARQYGKVSMVKPEMRIRGKKAVIGELAINEGDYITINVPYYGEPQIWLGKADLIEPNPKDSGLLDFIDLAKKQMTHFHVRANSDSPRDASMALLFGAEGIGLCRTEHMFFNEKRINVIREMILSDTQEERIKALEKLKPMQREDFYGLFKVMAGKEVTIRLLDAPLHEFLPHNEPEMDALVAYLGARKGATKLTKAEIRARCDSLSEFNPMLGHRGCRIAVSYPEIYDMQIRAIFEAVYRLQKEKIDVRPEVMIPVVMNSSELKLVNFGKKIEGKQYRGLVEIEEEVRKELGAKPVPFKIGTMVELPAAALSAGEIARYSEFFSFGTNDLTQTTLGISRDDFNSFMPDYSLYDLIEGNPFSVLAPPVKELIGMAVHRGKLSRPTLVTGLCGEHGANPDNIRFCMDAGLDYVSCSPYQVPLSITAVAQAEIERRKA
ncbi:MAG TPA: putative PEP-binding protein, partial [Rectinemataceae bacterium]|nr:putative PEP-binding protein [Rectinemataceae bacterium]